jgi:Mycothiol maleylpyruvate isomerase N-terminal domain
MNGDDVRLATLASSKYLRGVVDADWSQPIAGLDWTVFDAVAHMIAGTLWYPIDLAAAGAQLDTLDIHALATSTHLDLVLTLEAFGSVRGTKDREREVVG